MLKASPEVESADFVAFWREYPRKVAKRAAMKAWDKLAPQQRARAAQVIARHAEYWRKAGRSAETIPHAATWLNGWRFDDELPERIHGRFNLRDYVTAARNEAVTEGMDSGTAAAPGRHLRRPDVRRTH